MHFHLPKPLHSWREFVGEVGIIVVGVLIALFLEQMVQRWEWQHKVEAAKEAMKLELLSDDAPEVYQRGAMHPCLVERLDTIRSAVEANRSRQEVTDLIGGFWIQFLTFDSLAHDAANTSEIATHMSPDELTRYTNGYVMMPLMDRTTSMEAADLSRLHALRRTGGSLSEAEVSQVLGAVEALRNDDRMMWVSVRFAIPVLRQLGKFDPKRMHRFMANARDHYGQCVRDLPENFPNNLPEGA